MVVAATSLRPCLVLDGSFRPVVMHSTPTLTPIIITPDHTLTIPTPILKPTPIPILTCTPTTHLLSPTLDTRCLTLCLDPATPAVSAVGRSLACLPPLVA